MRVAHITTVALSLRYLLLNQMRRIQAEGYEVCGVSADGPEAARLTQSGVPHIAVPLTRKFSPLADLRSLWSLYRLLRRERYTIVHTHTAKPGLLGLLAARCARVPVIVHTIHGYHFNAQTPKWARYCYIRLERLAACCADLLLTQGRAELQLAVKEKICPPEKIKLLGNGIDLAQFDPYRLKAAQLRERRAGLGLREDDLVVGFVGRLVAEKGLHELLKAARLVGERVANVRFLIIGPTDADKPDALTPALAERYGVADVCVFAGQQEAMPELYALMNVFVLPSHREGFPRSPMEASAMGLPIVVSDISGCRETVVPDETGVVFPVGNSEALAAILVRLLTQPYLAAQLGQAGYHYARRHFDEQIIFSKVLAEYQRLLRLKGYLPDDQAAGPVLAMKEGTESHVSSGFKSVA